MLIQPISEYGQCKVAFVTAPFAAALGAGGGGAATAAGGGGFLAPFLAGSTISGGLGALGDFFGAQAQTQALTQAQSASEQEASRQRKQQEAMLRILQQLFQEAAPTRAKQFEATQTGLRGLTEAVERQPGTGLPFERALAGGTRGLTGQLEQFGVSPDSSVFAESLGELTGALTAADVDRITQIQQFLAGQAPSTLGAATQFGGLAQGFGAEAAGQTTNVAKLLAGQGAVQGGLASSLGSRFGQPIQQFANLSLLQSPQFQQLLGLT